MWPFGKRKNFGIDSNGVRTVDGITEIDVRGQTCPGYLLAINKEVEMLSSRAEARLVISYPPCGDGVEAWCKRKGVEYLGMAVEEGIWVISIWK